VNTSVKAVATGPDTPGLVGKIVMITGEGSGIGRAAAIAFSRAGGRVVLAGRHRDAVEDTRAMLPDPTSRCPLYAT
jgi:NAD(P)-dependent dehydrogenase (short-subunit alcohol dehydrogenase family)